MFGKFAIYVLKYKEYHKQKEKNDKGNIFGEIC